MASRKLRLDWSSYPRILESVYKNKWTCVLIVLCLSLCGTFVLIKLSDCLNTGIKTPTRDQDDRLASERSIFHGFFEAFKWFNNDRKVTDMGYCKHYVRNIFTELGFFEPKLGLRRLHKGDCSLYVETAKRKHRTSTNIFRASEVSSSDSVTLITHLTSDRFNRLVEIMKTWTGPVSAAVSVNIHADLDDFTEKLCSAYTLHQWKEFYLHIVKDEGELYPVNYLRNTALNNTQTDFIFINDVDFVPMPNAYPILYKYARASHPSKTEVLVIPAFAVKEEGRTQTRVFPKNKYEVILAWKEGLVEPFRLTAAHQSTHYSKWMQASSPYYIQWMRYYEPYVVIRKDLTPRFEENFVGRAYDKSSYIMQLQAMRFKFLVLPDVFILHLPHPTANADWFRRMGMYRCAEAVERKFIQKLKKRYEFHLK